MASLKTVATWPNSRSRPISLSAATRIAIPFGEDNDFDLILSREDPLERVQVKYTESEQ